METKVYFLFLWLVCSYSYCQVLDTNNPEVQSALQNAQVEGSPLANFFQKRTPAMDLLFPLLKDDDGIERHYVGAEIGSAYVSEKFQPGKVFYNNEELGDVFYRLNAYNDEVEIKKTDLEEEKQLALVKNQEIKLITNSKELLFRTFIDEKGKRIEGYLNKLWQGNNYIVYQRIYKKFSEPKPAANSMVAPIPSRFTEYTAYYYQKTDEKEIVEIPLKTNKFLSLFNKENQNKTKEYIKINKYNLDKESNLIKIFQYVERL